MTHNPPRTFIGRPRSEIVADSGRFPRARAALVRGLLCRAHARAGPRLAPHPGGALHIAARTDRVGQDALGLSDVHRPLDVHTAPRQTRAMSGGVRLSAEGSRLRRGAEPGGALA